MYVTYIHEPLHPLQTKDEKVDAGLIEEFDELSLKKKKKKAPLAAEDDTPNNVRPSWQSSNV